MTNDLLINRRRLLIGSGALAMAPLFPAWAQSAHGGHSGGSAAMAGRNTGGTLSGETIALTIGAARYAVGKRSASAVAVNGTIPAPLIRLREGQNVRIAVTNHLQEQSSIHWHGLLVPFHMDGVPGLSFPGIDPGENFTYAFPVSQSGTYWYHSHSGMQEATGLYGPIVIDPAIPDTVAYDREYVLMLADWSPVHPHIQLKKLKTMGGYYNWQRQTIGGLIAGTDQSLKERLEWANMRMDPTDISDVTGATYSYLINGHDTEANWTALFAPGERIRLRIINASAMTNFNLRVPGLPMTVVAADGCNVQPVEADEIQIAIAETYDVIVQPAEPAAFGIVAEAIDRSGLVRATLAPQIGMSTPVPTLRKRPLLTMRDMGMDMRDMEGMDMAGHSMAMRDFSAAPGVKKGPGVATIAPMPTDRLADRGTGLEDEDHRVLTYSELRARDANPDPRTPTRQIDVNLTANMELYMWSIDGETISDGAAPIPFRTGERVRVNLINHTMMPHPIHLHGHFFELVTGEPGNRPRKHTVNVLPGGKVSFDLTADAPGDWAFHCHMLLHMHAGMMRVVTVRADKEGAA
ncbi:copper resistance system multicopper oxidase [Novosphingobium sp. MMS21-SN21R]|uniref:copper resistance system multicopper oxidase n=1 Tax=Novosphingobium sp. MMS21-SN21R TaxID=2969298 RepID=UPI002887999B|nr:copper resistance system multicopper oxidase [Novosphingobium sp. MMS21-SN21R]MDT0509175.1 copper resistance system multicopper oxidase [Novosphingobium sp. MMS21-SN21R]